MQYQMAYYKHDVVEFQKFFDALSDPDTKKEAVQQRVSLTADILEVCK
jgi:hypothetical protein